MAGAGRFEIAPFSIVHAGGTMNLQQMHGIRVVSGTQLTRIRPGATVRTLASILARAKPTMPFSTRDLATFFTDVSPVTGLAASGAVTMRLWEREEGGVFETGAENLTLTATGGILIPQSVTAERDSVDGATLQAVFHPKYDGTNLPIVVTDAVDFDLAPAAAFTSQFYLGPVYHNSAEILGVMSATVEFGITIAGAPLTPGPYDKSLCIVDVEPVIRFTTHKADAAAAVSMFSRALSSSLAVYFQKGAASSDRVAAATEQHCKLSCTAGNIVTEEIGGEAGQDALVQFTVHPTSDLAVSVASAIP